MPAVKQTPGHTGFRACEKHPPLIHRVYACLVLIFGTCFSPAARNCLMLKGLFPAPAVLRSCLLGFLLCILACCGSVRSNSTLVDETGPESGWERIRDAAVKAAKAPETWVPALGAVVLQINDADQRVSDWAVERTPVYGSQKSADRKSDILLAGSGALWIATGLATPAGSELAEWTANKAFELGMELGAGAITRSVIGDMKAGSDRTRPNNADQSSFPSGHASGASFYMTVSSRHVSSYGWSPGMTKAAQFGLGTIAAATAWARVEAQHHYPSDVLAGLAVGHFLGAFLTEAFLGPQNAHNVSLFLEPSRDSTLAALRFRF